MVRLWDEGDESDKHYAYVKLKDLLSEKVSYTGAFGQREEVTVSELMQDIGKLLPAAEKQSPAIPFTEEMSFRERERAKSYQGFVAVTPVTLANILSDLTSLPDVKANKAKAVVVKLVQTKDHIMEQLHENAGLLQGGKGKMRGIPENVGYSAQDAQQCYYSMLEALDKVYDRIGQIAADAGISRPAGRGR